MGGAGPFVGSGLDFLLNSVAISRGGMRIQGEAMLTLGSFLHVGSRRAVWAAKCACTSRWFRFFFFSRINPFSFGGSAGELLGQSTGTSENPASRLQSSVGKGGEALPQVSSFVTSSGWFCRTYGMEVRRPWPRKQSVTKVMRTGLNPTQGQVRYPRPCTNGRRGPGKRARAFCARACSAGGGA